MNSARLSLVPLFTTAFLDLLGLGIIIPVLAPIFLDVNNGIFSPNVGLGQRTFLLGLLIGLYPLAQFFGAPILGAMSDKYGRRKILLLALGGSLIGYAIFGIGIIFNKYILLACSRILAGFTGGNISIVQSAIADISDKKSRSSNFGIISLALALGFILGPYIGGKLADSSLVSWFDYSTPFWFAGLLTLINIVLVILYFPETLKKPRDVTLHLLTSLDHVIRAFTLPHLRVMLLIVFLLTFAFNFFAQFFQVFLVEKFHYTQGSIGDLFAYTGLWIAITQGLLLQPVVTRFGERTVLSASILASAVLFPLLIFPRHPILLYEIIPFIAITQGFINPIAVAIVSNMTPPEEQGEVLGINQSITSLGQAIPPIIAGSIVSLHMNAPIVVAAIIMFISWLIFEIAFKPVRSTIQHPS